MNILLEKLRVILPIVVIGLAGYVFISENDTIMPFVMFFMGIMLLIAGIIEIKQEEQKKMGIFSVIVSMFIFYVFVQILSFNS